MSAALRVFTASLATETNTFSPVPTDRASFEAAFYHPPGAHPATPSLCSAVIPALRARAAREGFALIEGTAAWAEPGGLLRQDVWEALRDEILGQLAAALPVDAVVLGLHGAMVARGCLDCEGDLLARVRALVGPTAVVAAELDPHSHLTALRVANADILAAFHEFPHTDFEARAAHVVDLALAAARRRIRPVISSFDCRMIDVFPTSQEPMRGFVDRMRALEGRECVLSVSLIHGFMAADVPEMGTQMLVVTDAAPAAGRALAERLGREIFALRGRTRMTTLTVEAALAELARRPGGDRPVVLADIWDNPGGGVAGDNTALLAALLEAGHHSLGVAAIWDPQAAALAHGAGLGARLPMRIGGKTGPASGPPLDLEVEVVGLADPGTQGFCGARVTLGRAAALRVMGTEADILVTSNRTQTFEPDIFTGLGVDPCAKRVLLVKSTNHFHAGFAPIAERVLYVAVPGIYPSEPRRTPYTRLARPIWPIVVDPFAGPAQAAE
jgi:microcystin degradation protein MlrC